MADNAEVSYGRIRHATRFDQAGNEISEVIVPIHIGGHGPFTERFTRTEFEDGFTVNQRIEKLRASLNGLAR